MTHIAFHIEDEQSAREWASAALQVCNSGPFKVRATDRQAALFLADAFTQRGCFASVSADVPEVEVRQWIDD
ncbi:MAG TPA: hypothetical protein VEX38_02405 [Fimbriimonadaceae bacterium]|nr:hypothetical protein [Fimbriimonadaceae bacterium]